MQRVGGQSGNSGMAVAALQSCVLIGRAQGGGTQCAHKSQYAGCHMISFAVPLEQETWTKGKPRFPFGCAIKGAKYGIFFLFKEKEWSPGV